MNIPEEILEAARKVEHWAETNDVGSFWEIGGVCSRRFAYTTRLLNHGELSSTELLEALSRSYPGQFFENPLMTVAELNAIIDRETRPMTPTEIEIFRFQRNHVAGGTIRSHLGTKKLSGFAKMEEIKCPEGACPDCGGEGFVGGNEPPHFDLCERCRGTGEATS